MPAGIFSQHRLPRSLTPWIQQAKQGHKARRFGRQETDNSLSFSEATESLLTFKWSGKIGETSLQMEWGSLYIAVFWHGGLTPEALLVEPWWSHGEGAECWGEATGSWWCSAHHTTWFNSHVVSENSQGFNTHLNTEWPVRTPDLAQWDYKGRWALESATNGHPTKTRSPPKHLSNWADHTQAAWQTAGCTATMNSAYQTPSYFHQVSLHRCDCGIFWRQRDPLSLLFFQLFCQALNQNRVHLRIKFISKPMSIFYKPP